MSDSREAAEAREDAQGFCERVLDPFKFRMRMEQFDYSDLRPHVEARDARHAAELAEANGEVERLHEQLADAGVVEVSPGHWRFTMAERFGKALADLATIRAERDAAQADLTVARYERDEAKAHASDMTVACNEHAAERDAAAADLAATRSRLDEAERLLRGWSDTTAALLLTPYPVRVVETDAFLAASQPSPSTPVPLETGGGGALERDRWYCSGRLDGMAFAEGGSCANRSLSIRSLTVSHWQPRLRSIRPLKYCVPGWRNCRPHRAERKRTPARDGHGCKSDLRRLLRMGWAIPRGAWATCMALVPPVAHTNISLMPATATLSYRPRGASRGMSRLGGGILLGWRCSDSELYGRLFPTVRLIAMKHSGCGSVSIQRSRPLGCAQPSRSKTE